MKTLLLPLTIGLILSSGAFAQNKPKEDKKDVVAREVDVKLLFPDGYGLGKVYAQNYQILVINAENLPKEFPDKKDQARLKKQVDFTKQHLLLFIWESGGDDSLTYAVHPVTNTNGPGVMFLYKPGKVRKKPDNKKIPEDLLNPKRQKRQFRAFVLARDVPYLLAGWPFVPGPGSIPKSETRKLK